MIPENLHNKIIEGIFLSSKCYSYICENDILENENKIKITFYTQKVFQIVIQNNL